MTEENSNFFGHLKKIRIISQFGSYWNRLAAYEETEQRITINNKGHVWITRYYRAPCLFDPDQLLSKEYLHISPEATIRIMETAEDCFAHYRHEIIRDSQMWYAQLINTEGDVFKADGSQSLEVETGMYRLTELIQNELNKPDLLLLGSYKEVLDEDGNLTDQQEIQFEKLMRKAEESLHQSCAERIEILSALERCYYDCSEDKAKRIEFYRMLHQYAVSLEAEKPVRHSKERYTWEDMAKELYSTTN